MTPRIRFWIAVLAGIVALALALSGVLQRKSPPAADELNNQRIHEANEEFRKHINRRKPEPEPWVPDQKWLDLQERWRTMTPTEPSGEDYDSDGNWKPRESTLLWMNIRNQGEVSDAIMRGTGDGG